MIVVQTLEVHHVFGLPLRRSHRLLTHNSWFNTTAQHGQYLLPADFAVKLCSI